MASSSAIKTFIGVHPFCVEYMGWTHASHNHLRLQLTINAATISVIVPPKIAQNPHEASAKGMPPTFMPQAPNTEPAIATTTVTTVSVFTVWLSRFEITVK